jgi:hypothetical protein
MCHLIFFIPFFALPVFWILPFNTALTIYLIICGISFFIYFKIEDDGQEVMAIRRFMIPERIFC